MIRLGKITGAVFLMLASLFSFSGHAAAGPDRSAWDRFKSSFVAADGRVTDEYGGRSHSEGQGYAMLLATIHEDREAFNRIARWTEANLKRKDGLYSWAWKDGRIEDENNATDGDILIAWAYLRAAKWDAQYYQRGVGLAARIRERLVIERDDGAFLLPGLHGFDENGELVLNPSYWVFPALKEFARFDSPHGWQRVIETGFKVLDRGTQGPWKMAPDWITWPSAKVWQERPALSSYDAMRIPLYLVWAGYHTPAISAWPRFWSETNRPWHNVTTGEFAPYTPQSEHYAISMLARRANGENNLSMKDIPMGGKETGYYSAVLTLLVQAAWLERFEP